MAVDTPTMAALVLISLAATLIIGYLGYKKTKTVKTTLSQAGAAIRSSSPSPTATHSSPPPPSSDLADRPRTSV